MEKQKQQELSVSQALVEDDKKKVTFTVDGEEVSLSRTIVRRYLARGDGDFTDAEIVQFISLCRVNQLNPFVGDAYLVKFKGQNPSAQMIISKSAFMKRAESDSRYDGYQAGVIVQRGSDVIELEGAFFLPGDILSGAWAKVYKKDIRFPVVARVRMQEYDKQKSTWNSMPGTMIRKVAIAQAFREAFPLKVGGMYLPEEQAGPEIQQQPDSAQLENSQQPKFIDAPAPEETGDQEAPEFTPDPEPVEDSGPAPDLVRAGLIDPDPADEKDEEADPNDSLFKI